MNGAEHSPSEKYLQAVLIVILSAYFIVFCIINFFGFERFCTPDVYADTVIARIMWEQKTIFPSGWVFGNQYYVVATPVLAALFYGITGSINIAMALATTLMTLLILAAFAWMVRPFVDRTQLLFGLLCLVSGIICFNAATAIEGQILYILASYYSCYVITLFVVWGCYIRSLFKKEGKFYKPAFIIALVLAFGTGMQSLRQTAVMVIPLAAFELLRILFISVRSHAIPARKDWYAAQKVAVMCIANISGYILMQYLDIPNVTVYGRVAPSAGFEFARNAVSGLCALRSITGLKYAGSSAAGIFSIVFGAFMIGMVLWFQGNSVAKKKATGNGLLCYSLLGTLSILCVLIINLVLDISLRSIYLFVWYPLVAYCAAGAAGTRHAGLKNALILFFCVLSLGNFYMSYLPCAMEALTQDKSLEKKIAAWVEDKGYKLIYGKWYVIGKVAPYTDGAVTAGSWLEEPYKVLGYINPLNVYSGMDNTRAVYMLSASERKNALRLAAERGAAMTEVASFGNGEYVLYTSSIRLMHGR